MDRKDDFEIIDINAILNSSPTEQETLENSVCVCSSSGLPDCSRVNSQISTDNELDDSVECKSENDKTDDSGNGGDSSKLNNNPDPPINCDPDPPINCDPDPPMYYNQVNDCHYDQNTDVKESQTQESQNVPYYVYTGECKHINNLINKEHGIDDNIIKRVILKVNQQQVLDCNRRMVSGKKIKITQRIINDAYSKLCAIVCDEKINEHTINTFVICALHVSNEMITSSKKYKIELALSILRKAVDEKVCINKNTEMHMLIESTVPVYIDNIISYDKKCAHKKTSIINKVFCCGKKKKIF